MQLELFMAILFILIFLNTCLAWLVFARVSMNRIEKELIKEGLDRTSWDGIGSRAIFYADCIFHSNVKFNRVNNVFVDVEAVKRHVTARDKKLAAWMTISGWCLIAYILAYAALFGLNII